MCERRAITAPRPDSDDRSYRPAWLQFAPFLGTPPALTRPAHPIFAAAYYNVSGYFLAPLWICSVFSGIGSAVVFGAVGQELFPTSYRSTAAGARMIVGTLGGVLGLAVESVAPLIVAAFFPETSGRSLEEISPER